MRTWLIGERIETVIARRVMRTIKVRLGISLVGGGRLVDSHSVGRQNDGIAMMEVAKSAQYRYVAFVSYCSRDRRIAEWLHGKLERFRLPRVTGMGRWRPGQRLGPVFRDREELHASPSLESAVEDALRASRFLVVVCSPSAAQSDWVNKEIRYFRSLGRSDRVLTVIVDGEPVSGALRPTGAFPPALFDATASPGAPQSHAPEPLGADLRREGDRPREAICKLVAPMAGMQVGELTNRIARVDRFRRVLIASLLCACGCLGLLWWNYQRPKVRHFANIAWRWSVPFGVGELDRDTISKRGHRFEVTSRRGRVERVDRVNSRGFLSTESYGPACSMRVIYGDSGQAVALEFLDVAGQLVQRIEFSEIQRDPGGRFWRRERFTNASGISVAQMLESPAGAIEDLRDQEWAEAGPKPRSEITQRLAVFDDHGQMIEERTENSFGIPKCNSSGSFGFRHTYGHLGLPELSASINRNGDSAPFDGDVVSLHRSFGRDGNLLRVTCQNEFGLPVHSPKGICITEYDHDSAGNIRQIRLIGLSGEPAHCNEGWAAMRFLVGDDGLVNQQQHLDTTGSPTPTRELGAVVKILRNESGLTVEIQQFDADGVSWARQGPSSTAPRTKFVRDANGLASGVSFHDPDGSPLRSINGYHRLARAFDGSGRLTEMRYLDADGFLCRTGLGYSMLRVDFDEDGRVIGSTVFGPDAESPTVTSSRGAVVRWKRDERGNVVEIANFDAQMVPVLVGDGYHAIRRELDDAGRIQSESRIGLHGQVLESWDGVATTISSFDERGRLSELIRRNSAGNLADGRDGWSRKSIRYVRSDGHGTTIEYWHFGADGSPRKSGSGPVVVVVEIDRRGRVELEHYRNADGMPVVSSLGQGFVRFSYDDHNREVSRAHFALDGRPIPGSAGGHRVSTSYDPQGRVQSERHLDQNGAPVVGVDGVHQVDYEHDRFGRVVATRYLGVAHEPAYLGGASAGAALAFDSLGRISERVYLGPGHRPGDGPNGVVRVRYEYDDLGRVAAERFFDESARPMWSGDAAAGVEFSYDSAHRIIAKTFVDTTGAPVHSTSGFSEERLSYDNAGRIVTRARFNGLGREAMDKNFVHREEYAYDVAGNLVSERRFDWYGRLTALGSGFAVKLSSFDACGRVIGETLMGIDETPLKGVDVVAFRRFERDEMGNVMRRIELAASENSSGPGRVLSDTRFSLDASGRVIGRRNFDGDGKACLDGLGCHSYQFGYDRSGWIAEEARFGLELELMPPPAIAFSRYRRDARGRFERVEYFDAHGNRAGNEEGHCCILTERDGRGNEVLKRYVSDSSLIAEGSSMRGEETRRVFNERNLETRVSFHAADGSLSRAIGPLGWSISTHAYDESNRLLEVAVFGPSGEPVDALSPGDDVRCGSPFHRHVSVYDRAGFLSSLTYFKADGSACAPR